MTTHSAKSAVLFQAFNRLEFTKRALQHHLDNVKCPHQLVIADNGSTDGTREYLKQLEKGGLNADFIYYQKNIGRDRVRCHFIQEYWTQFDYLGLFANDVLVSPGWVSAFEHVLGNVRSIGIIGPVDRGWGGRDLKESKGIRYYGGKHFYFSDAFWLMRSSVVHKIQKSHLMVDGKKVPHPGCFVFNLISGSQEWYWDSIQAAGFETACHPDHWMKFVWRENPTTAEWHRKYTVLNKIVYCKDPERYLRDSAGPVIFEQKGLTAQWIDESIHCRECPKDVLEKSKNKPMAQLDLGATEADLGLLSE